MYQQEGLTAQTLLRAYLHGIFPMALTRTGPVQWFSPDPRAVLPLDRFHVPRTLARRVRRNRFAVTCDQAFADVIRACGDPRPSAPDTWLSEELIGIFCELHAAGFAHSIEAWDSDPGDTPPKPRLVGGLYGVSIGAVFFGESMFSRATDASKVCLVHLVRHMRSRGYTLLDIQFTSDHMQQFGAVEIPRDRFLSLLSRAIALPTTWGSFTP